MIACSAFDPLPGSTDAGVRWCLSPDGSFDRNSGHGQVIFGRIGAVKWQRALEPGTVPLVALAGLALTRQVRTRGQQLRPLRV